MQMAAGLFYLDLIPAFIISNYKLKLEITFLILKQMQLINSFY